ncbi:amidohydrolase [Salipaludibacillus sp. CUR1]|uniref:M20 metallopeptidase family protein n=1 Tax=Salipaludibacillus sp. CUR1 TaxID=2820003 RepID=UPI001E329C7B|nr:amidohydrolase [Salipaludibacillus sp. CUR1]
MASNYELPSELKEWIIKQRRYLHQYPELSHCEVKTRQYIREQLEQMNLRPVSYTGKDVVADLKGSSTGPVIAVRADMDALEVEEETGLPFASEIPGVMHACGHDGHMAIVLGVAKHLSRHPEMVNGTVRFIFQHAEETVPGGAEELVKAGVLDGVSAILGCHLWEPLPKDKTGFLGGPVMAGADRFSISVQGKGGHGSMPHLTVDPVLISTHAIQQLYHIVSRQVAPYYPAVLSIGELKMGSAYNIIPDKAYFSGTVRYFNHEVQKLFQKNIKQIMEGVCTSFGASYDFSYDIGEPPLINDESLISFVKKQAEDVLPSEKIVQAQQSLGGEDFAYYSNEIPAAYFFLGIGETGKTYGHHHPKFDIDEDMMAVGTEILLRSTVNFLKTNQ